MGREVAKSICGEGEGIKRPFMQSIRFPVVCKRQAGTRLPPKNQFEVVMTPRAVLAEGRGGRRVGGRVGEGGSMKGG